MKPINFKRKIYIGIILAVVIVLSMGSLFYYTNVAERATEDWITHSIEVEAKMQKIAGNLKDLVDENRAKRRYNNVDNLFQHAGNKTSLVASMNELRILVKDNRIQTANVNVLQDELEKLFELWQGINIEEVRRNIIKEESYFRKESVSVDAFMGKLNEMDHYEKSLLTHRRDVNNASMNFNNAATISGSIFILIVVLGLGYNITSEFDKRNKAEKSLKERMEEQERLNQQIALNNDVLVSLQTLTAACQKSPNVPVFLQTVLDGILNFTHFTSGIVYLVKENEPDQLVPLTYHGIPAVYVKETGIHNLLAHQQDNQSVVYIEDIPADFWHLSSASGSKLPGTMVYIYIRLKDQLLCLIELGCFQSPGLREREFLRMLPAAIAIRLAALQLTENRNLLMSELQMKQEMLLNQQEELRQSNEELLQQTKILQSSEEELRVQEEELKQINTELEEKHDALELANHAMDLKAAELEQSTKYKSEFLANMSHELRTPLNSILILANLLGDNKDRNLSEKQVEYARIIGNSGSDLLKLINDILDLSKIEAGKVDLSIEPVAVATIANRMQETFGVMTELKKIGFKINVDKATVNSIRTDIQRLEQILKNLLSNAIKFTPEGGTVSLDIEMEGEDAITFKVTDTGIGIDPEKLELIFEAFKQEDGSTNRKYGGTGLGLSISKELTKMLNGTLTVESKPKQGSTFRLIIPLAVTNQTNVIPAVSQHKLSVTSEENNNANNVGKTILIVEDDPNFSNILKNYAEEKCYKTLVAVNGREGLEMAKRHKPDAIILDLHMPVMNGWEVLRALRLDPELKTIPVHVISAMDEDKIPMSGIVEYVRKPVTIDELEKTFRHIGAYIAAVKHRLLIWSEGSTNDQTLKQLIANLPSDVKFDRVTDIQELIELGKKHHYDCILADINTSETHFDNLQQIRENNLFSGTSLILLIDQEISAADEMRLKKLSEAIVMKTKEAHTRLKDELEIFMFHVKDHKPDASKEKEPFVNNDLLHGKKVLVADDDMRNVFALVGLLENHNMEVITASNGVEALEALDDYKDIDIILMDIMMPEMDGYEAMRKIRSNKRFSELPIIALTAKAMSNDRELCIEAGASDYMSKPINSQKLLSLIRIWLS